MVELTEEEKRAQAEALEVVQKAAEAKANEVVSKALEGRTFVSKEDAEAAVEEAKKELQKNIDSVSAVVKAMKQTREMGQEKTDIHSAIQNAIVEGAEVLKSFNGSATLTMKAVTDASWAPGALERQTNVVRTNLYMSPYSPFYLRNIFPNVSTDGGSITIPQIQSYTGAAAVWARGTGSGGADVEKPEVTPTYKDVTVTPKWIAGFTTVNRELLMNVSYLQSSIVNTLLYSRVGLFAAENKLITDYLAANAVPYNGSKTIGAEIILDAAFNQLLGNYLVPTHILMNQADYLTFIKFNKASGSGEYDLPNNELKLVNTNGLEVSLQVIPVPSIPAGTAYVVAANEFEFINRLNPELKVSEEHGTNFTYNKVTFRAEEMAAFIAKDLNAAVKIDLSKATNGGSTGGGTGV